MPIMTRWTRIPLNLNGCWLSLSVSTGSTKRKPIKKNPGGSSGITLDRVVAMIAAHLGVVDEKQIDNMSFVSFEDVLDALGHKLHYDAVVRCW